MQSLLDRHAACPKPFVMDFNHGMMIFASVLSKKPKLILELGFGTGFVTGLILDAIDYNGCGVLHVVDNWLDFKFEKPPEVKAFENRGAMVITSDEHKFVSSCPTGPYDFLVSDAGHQGNFFDEHCRICTNGAMMFFHDTNQPQYPGLFAIEARALAKKMMCVQFAESSRPDEDCGRGLLLVVK